MLDIICLIYTGFSITVLIVDSREELEELEELEEVVLFAITDWEAFLLTVLLSDIIVVAPSNFYERISFDVWTH